MTNIVEIKNINLSYGDNHVLKNINIEIKEKDFFTFLGPSGCGKTTLLRLIAGFEKSQSGEVFVSGQEISNLNPWERNVGMVFQNYALWPHMTVFKNISFGLEEKKFSKIEINEKVKEILKLVDLAELSERYPYQLSGGQQQRVALARTLIIKPKVLLLDEPLSNLDAKLRIQMREELLTMHQKLGITIIFVTHDQEEANSMSDTIAVFNKGIVQQIGKPIDLYNNPKNLFVANFLGTTNIIDGSINKNNNENYFKSNKGLIIKNIFNDTSGECKILLRPQNLYLEKPNSDIDYQEFEVKIIRKEFLGNIIRYTIDLNGHTLILDTVHEINRSIYNSNEIIKIYLNSKKIKTLNSQI